MAADESAALTFDDLRLFIVGEAGLTPSQFDKLSFTDADILIRAHSLKIERQARDTWEQTRLVMYTAILPHQKKNSKMDLNDVLPLPWDQPETAAETTPLDQQKEQIEAQRKKWAEIDRKRAERKLNPK